MTIGQRLITLAVGVVVLGAAMGLVVLMWVGLLALMQATGACPA